MGTNRWDIEIPKDIIIKQALKFSEDVKAKRIAKLINAWIDYENKLIWCLWETEDLDSLKKSFTEMNKQSGLKSELHVIDKISLK